MQWCRLVQWPILLVYFLKRVHDIEANTERDLEQARAAIAKIIAIPDGQRTFAKYGSGI